MRGAEGGVRELHNSREAFRSPREHSNQGRHRRPSQEPVQGFVNGHYLCEGETFGTYRVQRGQGQEPNSAQAMRRGQSQEPNSAQGARRGQGRENRAADDDGGVIRGAEGGISELPSYREAFRFPRASRGSSSHTEQEEDEVIIAVLPLDDR